MNPLAFVLPAAAALALAACGSPAGPFIPDVALVRPPMCSQQRHDLHVALERDAIARFPSAKEIASVQWTVGRVCATTPASDPNDGPGRRRGLNCEVVVYTRSLPAPSNGCDSTATAWRISGTHGRPDVSSFTLTGEVVGNVCIRATVTFTDGSTLDIPMRSFRIASSIPQIDYAWGDARRELPAPAMLTRVTPPSSPMCS